jgi:integrase
MAKFASAAKQASSVIKELQDKKIVNSLGTARNYTQALTRVANFVKDNKIYDLRSLTLDQAKSYLTARGEEVGQKALDMERQSIQAMFSHITGKLLPNQKMQAKSEREQILNGRSYTIEQAKLIADHQKGANKLATQVAHAAGLRAHELLTLRPSVVRVADSRPMLDSKWQGREGEIYTVQGKGGLVREVLIPTELAKQLEAVRLDSPARITDRTIHYQQRYNISGGNRWSASFNAAANRALSWSTGAHGLRHSYAQERMNELQKMGLTRAVSLETVSQEMGHFRPSITEVYLR